MHSPSAAVYGQDNVQDLYDSEGTCLSATLQTHYGNQCFTSDMGNVGNAAVNQGSLNMQW